MRRDIFLPLVGIVAALAMAAPAQAISLVVMATNTTAIPGEKVFTVGIQISSVDVAGAGAGATLLVQNLTSPVAAPDRLKPPVRPTFRIFKPPGRCLM
jgi:hypothetical protein